MDRYNAVDIIDNHIESFDNNRCVDRWKIVMNDYCRGLRTKVVAEWSEGSHDYKVFELSSMGGVCYQCHHFLNNGLDIDDHKNYCMRAFKKVIK